MRILRFLVRNIEGVSRRTHSDDRTTGLQVVFDLLHLRIRQIAEASCNDHQVRIAQRFQAGNAILVIRIDDSRSARMLGIQHGAIEAMMLRENLTQLRQRFFGAILFVAANQHDTLAFTGALLARIGLPLLHSGTGVRLLRKWVFL